MTTEQRDALITLALLPDEDGYPRRSVQTQDGDPERARQLLQWQPVAYACHQVIARENEGQA